MNKYYICNQKRCEKGSCQLDGETYCKHTSDRNYALHKGQVGVFEKKDDELWELDINKDDIVIMEV
jgi:hypothetical protein